MANYDPNDPNLGSQDPTGSDQSTPEAQARNANTTPGLTLNERLRQNPAIKAWLTQHRDGHDLSDPEKGQLFYLIKAAGTNPTGLEITDNGAIQDGTYSHEGRNTLIHAALLYGGGLLSGYITGLLGPGASESWDAAGNFIGPSTISSNLSVAGVESLPFGVDSGALANLGTGAMGPTAIPPLAGPQSLANLGGYDANAPVTDVGQGALDPATDPIVPGDVPHGPIDPATAPTEGPQEANSNVFDANGNFTGPSADATQFTKNSVGSVLNGIVNSKWFAPIVGGATSLIGSKIQADASTDAANIQAQSNKDALDFAKSQAALEQKNFAPYLAAGTGALSKLSYGLGIGNPIDYTATGGPASITPAGDPRVSPSSPAAQFIDSTRTQPVWMTAPTGERQQVPANQVQHYIDRGAKLDPGQGMTGGPQTVQPPPTTTQSAGGGLWSLTKGSLSSLGG